TSWLQHLNYAWDAANTFWNRWVMSYGPQLQKAAFARLGIDYGSWFNIGLTVLAAFIVSFAGVGAWFTARAWLSRCKQVVRLHSQSCRTLARLGRNRQQSEGPFDSAARAKHNRPECRHTIDTVTRLYVGLRYGRARQRDQLRKLAAAVANFQPDRR